MLCNGKQYVGLMVSRASRCGKAETKVPSKPTTTVSKCDFSSYFKLDHSSLYEYSIKVSIQDWGWSEELAAECFYLR